MQDVSGKQALAVAGLACITVAAVIYTVRASQEALTETRPDETLARERLTPKPHSYFDALDFEKQTVFPAPPQDACLPRARPILAQVAALTRIDLSSEVEPFLEEALSVDPDCVYAARLLLELKARQALHITLKDRFVGRALKEPHNAAAQLMATEYFRLAGDAASFVAALDAAEKVNPDQPHLHLARAYQFAVFANPRDEQRSIEENEREFALTGDLSAAHNLIHAYADLAELEKVREWCDRFDDVPQRPVLANVLHHCFENALELGASERAQRYREWVLATPSRDASSACQHADLSYAYRKTGRLEASLEEARTALQQGCLLVGEAQLRATLLQLGRYEEAARTLFPGNYWRDFALADHITALILVNRRDEAQALLDTVNIPHGRWGFLRRIRAHATQGPRVVDPGEEESPRLTILRALLEDGVDPSVLIRSLQPSPPATPAQRLSDSAAAYLENLELELARARLEKATSLDPRDPAVWANRVYLELLDNRLDEASRLGEEALKGGLEDGPLLANLGYVYSRLDQCERAVPLMQRAASLDPFLERNYTNLTVCLEKLGRSDDAAHFGRYVRGGPVRLEAWHWLVMAAAGCLLYFALRSGLRWLWTHVIKAGIP